MRVSEIDRYAHLDSFVHAWDARVRLVSLGTLVVSIAVLTHIGAAAVGLVFAVLLVIASRIPLQFVFHRLRWVLLVVCALFVVLALTASGAPIAAIGPIFLTWGGVRLGLLVALRATAIGLLVAPMFGTGLFHHNLRALEELGMPEKAVQLWLFTYRYLFLFADEVHQILVAARSRGWVARLSPSALGMAGNIVGMLVVRSVERANRVYNAMLSRGYEGRVSIAAEFDARPRDWFKAALVIGGAAVLQLVGRT